MSGHYVVTMFDKYGVIAERTADDLDGMVEQYREMKKLSDMKSAWAPNPAAFTFGNTDRCDEGDNGLTDEETERLENLGVI